MAKEYVDIWELLPETWQLQTNSSSIRHISSPLLSRLDSWLTRHPDKAFTQYVSEGSCYRAEAPSRSAPNNLYSAKPHPEVSDDYIASELGEGRMLRPFHLGEILGLHVSRMAVVPPRPLETN